MGYPLQIALRYMRSKKRDFISVSTLFAVLGVALGVAALVTVMSVTGGFQAQFREKVLGVNAHVLVLKYSTDFREYRDVMERVSKVPGVVGVAPFSINPMMLTHGDNTATGVLLKGVDPEKSLGVGAGPEVVPVLDLPKQIVEGELEGFRLAGAQPAARKTRPPRDPIDRFDPKKLGIAPDAGVDEVVEKHVDAAEADGGLDFTDDEKLPEGDFLKEVEEVTPEEVAAITPPESDEPEEEEKDDETDDDGAGGGSGEAAEPDDGYESELPPDDFFSDDIIKDICDDPELVKQLPGIVIGRSLAKTLALKLGDCVTVTSPTIGFSFSGGEVKPPVAKRFRVIAMFEAGFDQYDSKLVYTDLYEAQAFYDQGDTVTGVEMKVDDIERATAIAEEVSGMLAEGLYHTMDWMELNHGLFTALQIQQIGMSGVLALIIVVAAFTVIATLIMVVMDKKKEIAVLKAMGATDSAILRAFLYQGGIMGGVGTALGLLLGWVVCNILIVYGFPLDPKVYFIDHLPVQARPTEFLITGAIAVLICLLATVVPSLYAARMRPADGFRDR